MNLVHLQEQIISFIYWSINNSIQINTVEYIKQIVWYKYQSITNWTKNKLIN